MAQTARNWVRAASVAELQSARRLLRTVGEVPVLLLPLGGEIVAVRNACTHLGQPLNEGRVMAGQLHCPYHGACFDLRDGRAVSGPAVLPLQCFAVKVEDGEIFVAV